MDRRQPPDPPPPPWLPGCPSPGRPPGRTRSPGWRRAARCAAPRWTGRRRSAASPCSAATCGTSRCSPRTTRGAARVRA
ncbi:hypothetical protein NKH77_45300 [Streptomyces sp. M19]